MSFSLRRTASFLKWQLVPMRYMGRLRFLKPHHLTVGPKPETELARTITTDGYAPGPKRQGKVLKELIDTFLPRRPKNAPNGLKVPFVNLSQAEDFTSDNPLIQLAFSKDILDVALDYFGGRVRLDSLQVLHSFPQDGELKESQKWHLDYGDSKSLHCVMYLTDVMNDADGAFAFIDKEASRKVGRGLIVRRIEDRKMALESGNAEVQKVYGKAGTSVWIDPAACYHYGSRCVSPRTAVFVTFNSDCPFMAPVPLVSKNAKAIAEAGKFLRPDIAPDVIDKLLGL